MFVTTVVVLIVVAALYLGWGKYKEKSSYKDPNSKPHPRA